MQVASAILCDYATVRENLLYVIAGGVTRMARPEFPAPMATSLAVVLELHRTELDTPHEIRIRVQDEDGKAMAEVQGGFQLSSANLTELGVHERAYLPLALDLRPVGLPAPGWYSIEITIDGTHHRSLNFRVSQGQSLSQLSSGEAPPG